MSCTESNVGVGGEQDPGSERIRALEAEVVRLKSLIEMVERRMRGTGKQEERQEECEVVQNVPLEQLVVEGTKHQERKPLPESPTCWYCEGYDHVVDNCIGRKRTLELWRKLDEEKVRKGEEQPELPSGLVPECETESNKTSELEGVANASLGNCFIADHEKAGETKKIGSVLPVKQTLFRKYDVPRFASKERQTRQVPWRGFSESGKGRSKTRVRLNRRKEKETKKTANTRTVKGWQIEWSFTSERWRVWFLKILLTDVKFVTRSIEISCYLVLPAKLAPECILATIKRVVGSYWNGLESLDGNRLGIFHCKFLKNLPEQALHSLTLHDLQLCNCCETATRSQLKVWSH
ncbi:uncharacterized protein LOC134284444 [Aedes albopictus]|uniref:Uncharacterized protein n=1 Tax=Aedes albopictus TaxID=7160 RepID=A0ABM1YGK5_AEDAL